ncbi:hypothetical protein I2I11_16855 [Pontibacter sp. 172403-2]|uniref:hypothetical protein n=1 Tax=Pontibacter rufus TaxID=2791028 RepID=UPI0018AFC322|nr:hypothetical protein [Pontibacter sp. 172403-2]MBF9254976.1 hypothetical protein [Pontibacter sp. 172403-2]
MEAQPIDRVESKRMEKFKKLFFYIGFISVIILAYKVSTRTNHSGTTGFLLDCLLIVFSIYLTFRSFRNAIGRTGQFIEWREFDIQYKLKEDDSVKTIPIKTIKNINIGLDKIIVETTTNSYRLDIEDFTKYETIKRIKNNFERIKISVSKHT